MRRQRRASSLPFVADMGGSAVALLLLLLAVAATTLHAQGMWPGVGELEGDARLNSNDTASAWRFRFEQSPLPPPGLHQHPDTLSARLYIRLSREELSTSLRNDTQHCRATVESLALRWAIHESAPSFIQVIGTASHSFNLSLVHVLENFGGDADTRVLVLQSLNGTSLPGSAATGPWQVTRVVCGSNLTRPFRDNRLTDGCNASTCGFTQPRGRDVASPGPVSLSLDPLTFSTLNESFEVAASMLVMDDLSDTSFCRVILRSEESAFTPAISLSPTGPGSLNDVTVLNPEFEQLVNPQLVRTTALRGSVVFPHYTPRGNWTVGQVQCKDAASRVTFVLGAVVNTLTELFSPFHTHVTQQSEGDMQPPQPQALPSSSVPVVFSPSEVDTYFSIRMIEVRLDVMDDLSGVAVCRLTLQHSTEPTTTDSLIITLDELVFGTRTQGVLAGTLQVPAFTRQGIWVVSQLQCRDRAGRQRVQTSLKALAGLTESAYAFKQTGTGDVDPPIIHSFAVSRRVIDTSVSDQKVRFSFNVTDDLQVDRCYVRLQFEDDRSTQRKVELFAAEQPMMFAQDVVFEKGTPMGAWLIASGGCCDLAHNEAPLESTLVDAAFPEGAPHGVTQEGSGDSTPPAIIGVRFSHNRTSLAPNEPITIEVVASDTTGVAGCLLHFTSQLSRSIYSASVSKYIGPEDGASLLEGELVLTQRDPPDTYGFSSIYCTDVFGLPTTLEGADAAALLHGSGIGVVHDQVQDNAVPTVAMLNTTWDEDALNVTTAWTVADDVSGVVSCEATYKSAAVPEQTVQVTASIAPPTISGSLVGTAHVPTYLPHGRWQVVESACEDAAGRRVLLTPSILEARQYYTLAFDKATPGDVEPPSVLEASLSSRVIDTSDEQQRVTLTLRLKDDVVGPDTCAITFSAAGQAPSVVGQAHGFVNRDAPANITTVAMALTWPMSSSNAQWNATELTCSDADLAKRTPLTRVYSEEDIRTLFPGLTVQQRGPGDELPPTIHGVRFANDTVNSDAAEQAVLLQVVTSDDLSGPDACRVALEERPTANPSSVQIRHVHVGCYVHGSTYIPGATITCSTLFRLPQWSRAATFTLAEVLCQDRASRVTTIDRTTPEAQQLPALGEVVLTQIGVGDAEPPEVVHINLSPAVIDTTLSAQTVRLQMRITDDGSGVTQCTVLMTDVLGQEIRRTVEPPIPTTAFNATATVVVPQSSPSGRIHVTHITCSDVSGKDMQYFSVSLVRLAMASQSPLVVEQNGLVDTAPPQVTNVVVQPLPPQPSNPVPVTVVVEVTDDASGVASCQLFFGSDSQTQAPLLPSRKATLTFTFRVAPEDLPRVRPSFMLCQDGAGQFANVFNFAVFPNSQLGPVPASYDTTPPVLSSVSVLDGPQVDVIVTDVAHPLQLVVLVDVMDDSDGVQCDLEFTHSGTFSFQRVLTAAQPHVPGSHGVIGTFLLPQAIPHGLLSLTQAFCYDPLGNSQRSFFFGQPPVVVNVTSPVMANTGPAFISMAVDSVIPSSPKHGDAVTVNVSMSFTSTLPFVMCSAEVHNFLFGQSWPLHPISGLGVQPTPSSNDLAIRFQATIPRAVQGIHTLASLACVDTAGRAVTTASGPTVMTVGTPGTHVLDALEVGEIEMNTVRGSTVTATAHLSTRIRFDSSSPRAQASAGGAALYGCAVRLSAARSAAGVSFSSTLRAIAVSYAAASGSDGMITNVNFTLPIADLPFTLSSGATEVWGLEQFECWDSHQRPTLVSIDTTEVDPMALQVAIPLPSALPTGVTTDASGPAVGDIALAVAEGDDIATRPLVSSASVGDVAGVRQVQFGVDVRSLAGTTVASYRREVSLDHDSTVDAQTVLAQDRLPLPLSLDNAQLAQLGVPAAGAEDVVAHAVLTTVYAVDFLSTPTVLFPNVTVALRARQFAAQPTADTSALAVLATPPQVPTNVAAFGQGTRAIVPSSSPLQPGASGVVAGGGLDGSGVSFEFVSRDVLYAPPSEFSSTLQEAQCRTQAAIANITQERDIPRDADVTGPRLVMASFSPTYITLHPWRPTTLTIKAVAVDLSARTQTCVVSVGGSSDTSSMAPLMVVMDVVSHSPATHRAHLEKEVLLAPGELTAAKLTIVDWVCTDENGVSSWLSQQETGFDSPLAIVSLPYKMGAPTLLSASIAPALRQVNTSAGAAAIRAALWLSVQDPGEYTCALALCAPNSPQTATEDNVEARLALPQSAVWLRGVSGRDGLDAGDADGPAAVPTPTTSGLRRVHLSGVMPQFSLPGEWEVCVAECTALHQQQTRVTRAADLINLFGGSSYRSSDKVMQVGTSHDATAPVLARIDVAPAPGVTVSDADGGASRRIRVQGSELQLRVQGSDDRSGVSSVVLVTVRDTCTQAGACGGPCIPHRYERRVVEGVLAGGGMQMVDAVATFNLTLLERGDWMLAYVEVGDALGRFAAVEAASVYGASGQLASLSLRVLHQPASASTRSAMPQTDMSTPGDGSTDPAGSTTAQAMSTTATAATTISGGSASTSSFPIAVVAGAAGGGVLLILVIVLVVRKKRRGRRGGGRSKAGRSQPAFGTPTRVRTASMAIRKQSINRNISMGMQDLGRLRGSREQLAHQHSYDDGYLNVQGADDGDEERQGTGAGYVDETTFSFVPSSATTGTKERQYLEPEVRAVGGSTYAQVSDVGGPTPGGDTAGRTYLEPTRATAVNPAYSHPQMATDPATGRTYLEPQVQAGPAYAQAGMPSGSSSTYAEASRLPRAQAGGGTYESGSSLYARPRGEGGPVPEARVGSTPYAELGPDHVQYQSNEDITAEMKNLLMRQGYIPAEEEGGTDVLDTDPYEYARITHAPPAREESVYQEADMGPVYAEAAAPGMAGTYSTVGPGSGLPGMVTATATARVPRRRGRGVANTTYEPLPGAHDDERGVGDDDDDEAGVDFV